MTTSSVLQILRNKLPRAHRDSCSILKLHLHQMYFSITLFLKRSAHRELSESSSAIGQISKLSKEKLDSPHVLFSVKHICHMQSSEIKISLLARVSGWFIDQKGVFHLRIGGSVSAFPAISPNLYVISGSLTTQVSLSLHLPLSAPLYL